MAELKLVKIACKLKYKSTIFYQKLKIFLLSKQQQQNYYPVVILTKTVLQCKISFNAFFQNVK